MAAAKDWPTECLITFNGIGYSIQDVAVSDVGEWAACVLTSPEGNATLGINFNAMERLVYETMFKMRRALPEGKSAEEWSKKISETVKAAVKAKLESMK
jgi:hypothetical protein